MYIYWGELAEAEASAFQGWELYPYKRSEHKLGFTQSLFLALGMPEAQGEGASNLTMHQFLRVIYADQPSLHQPIFRNDNWDSPLTRETVGNYLSGAYDDNLYSAQLEKRELEKELSNAESELRSIFVVLAKSKQDIGIEFFGQQIIEAESLRQELKGLERKYSSAAESWSSNLEMALEAAARNAGALDQEIKGLYENQRLASVIEELRKKRDILAERIGDLELKITTLEDAQEKLKHEVSSQISSTLSRLLRKDLYRQAEFKTAQNVHFSFTDNKVAVDGSDRFSESSTVVLRLLFHVALLSASTKIKSMRFPRFLILDGIEDGGMEFARSHLLQRIIAEECSTYEVEYQLIMATSQIASDLDNEKFVVGREFTEDDRSIQIL